MPRKSWGGFELVARGAQHGTLKEKRIGAASGANKKTHLMMPVTKCVDVCFKQFKTKSIEQLDRVRSKFVFTHEFGV